MIHHISFRHAWNGIRYAFLNQPNFRVHSFVALFVLIAGVLLHLERIEWLILLFTITLVLVAEMVNTSLESLTDLVTQETQPQARIAKDVAAGMVLLTAIMAILVGLVILIPHILEIRN